MPMIEITTDQKVSHEQAVVLKTGLGSNISIFPGKPEARVMVAIKGEATMFFGGEEGPACLVSVALFLNQPEECYEKYSKVAIETVRKAFPNIPLERIYVKYQTLDHKAWGADYK